MKCLASISHADILLLIAAAPAAVLLAAAPAAALIRKEDLYTGVGFSTPVVAMNLTKENQTETRCVNVNNHELCTRIDYCPLESMTCSFGEHSGSYDCPFSPYMCHCTATWGGVPCSCSVSPDGPYMVEATFQCPGGLVYEGQIGYSCDAESYNCRTSYTFNTHDVNLLWRCPADVMDTQSHDQCTCEAMSDYKDCSRCNVCAWSDAGSLSVDCPGYTIDCENNFVVWHQYSGSSSRAVDLVIAVAVAIAMATQSLTTS
jgi:hypothetical protein